MNGMEFFGRFTCSVLVVGLWVSVNWLAVRDISAGKDAFGPLMGIHMGSAMTVILLWLIWAKARPSP